MASRTVIVFGPTGAVGSAAARTAEEKGAKVILAMRNTEKPIPGLTADAEKQRKFERVYADLTKPDSVSDAVKKTAAKHAFIYLAHGSTDRMKATIEALKSAGIELVVFLSSFTVRGDLAAIPRSELIPYVHAQVEISLEEVYGKGNYAAVRPGSFSSNTLPYKSAIHNGEVKVFHPEATVDNIVPEDIGRVSGTVLAGGIQDGHSIMYLYGPELLAQKKVIEILSKKLGKDPAVKAATEDEAREIFAGRGTPPPFIDYMINRLKQTAPGPGQVLGYSVGEEELSNVQKYSGQKPTTFEEWVDKNKHLFAS